MHINSFRFKLFSVYLFVMCILSYFVATRNLLSGTDAVVYRGYFLNLEFFQSGDRTFELGYHYFNHIVYYFSKDYSSFLFIFYMAFNLVYIKCLDNFLTYKNKKFYFLGFFLFLGLILFSSWYQSATLNGLRQGFSLVLLYLSFSYLFVKDNYKFLFFLIFSCLFHDSTLLILPFLILYAIKLKKVVYIFILTAIFYPLGVNEIMVSALSNVVDLPLHDAISSYSENNELWKGFQFNFYIYSVFWCLFFLAIHYKYSFRFKSDDFLVKTLLMLTIFYFVFGFGSFSNRFGFVAWLFLPIIQTFYLLSIGFIYIKRIDYMLTMVFFLSILGVVNYYFILRPPV